MRTRAAKSVLESGRVLFVPVGQIRPNPSQPRRVFDMAGLQELAASIAQYGVLQPLTVRKTAAGFELVAGERRLRASKMAGLPVVPCIVAAVDEQDSCMLAMVENLQRRDLDYIEQAEALARLMQAYHLSQEQAAQKIGKSQSAVANKLRLLQHSPAVLQALREGKLSERHARALLRVRGEAERLRVIALILQNDWTVAKTEQFIDELAKPAPQEKKELGAFKLRDVRVFFNSVNHQLELIRAAGIEAGSERRETDAEIVLTIRIPKKTAKL
ncbi:MAG: ParB/RepB/Spo0J family partition protein [Clostridia bacterium]|nr:ParB/RepB/Spo0J family partition protein [Clostridia bacterium]